jgi:hypothetical protein
MLKIRCLPIVLSLTVLIPITVLATEDQKLTSPNIYTYARKKADVTIRGKIYLEAKHQPEAKCDKKLIRVTLSKRVPIPNYNPSLGNERYIYITIANSDARNHRISGDIKKGYCEYVLRDIPKVKGSYELSANVQNDEQFPNDAPVYCTVSPLFSEPIGWKNPISSSTSFDTNKDMKLTRVVAKCQP